MAIENQVDFASVTVGCVENALVNDERRTLLIATTEATVVAAARHAAKRCAALGGITAQVHGPAMATAQIMYSRLPDPPAVLRMLNESMTAIANRAFCTVQPRGGTLSIDAPRFVPITRNGFTDTQIVLEVSLRCDDAMGAGMVTRAATRVAEEVLLPFLGHRPTLVICKNTAIGTTVTAIAEFRVRGGQRVRDRLLDIVWFAECDLDPGRAATANKGMMNAVTGIGLATGQDTQAMEAAVHCMKDGYRPLMSFAPVSDDRVCGELTLRLPMGIVGGGTDQSHAVRARRLMGVRSSRDLVALTAAGGLLQTFAAHQCLADEGIPAAWERVSEPYEPSPA